MANYVSRGGEKMEYALKVFNINPSGLVCADFGCSTGGFVDCLLQNGAEKVFAIDTGYGVLDWRLRTDKRVVVLERKNAMHIVLPEKVDLISTDTSWTKLEKVIPNIKLNLKSGGKIIMLIKPHYEAEPYMIKQGKLVDEYIPDVLSKVKNTISNSGLEVLREVESPILGGKAKNREFLIFLRAID